MALYVDSGYYEVGYTIDDIIIDWGTKEIFVPKEFTTLVQTNPNEIRQLSINDFRLKLKELESGVEGIPHVRTHTHNAEVLLGGIVYARVVKIINGYTITFEDGAYSVNLVGANSNIGDVINLNQVSVRSSNSAGLISNQAIEYASFNGAVTIDVNGTTGTAFPRGTPQEPVNNVPDAVLIAELRGFNTIYVRGDFTFSNGDELEGYVIIGESPEKSYLEFETEAALLDVNVFNSTITGIFDGSANFDGCVIIDTQFVQGTIKNCVLNGEIGLSGNSTTILIDCKDGLVLDGDRPSINFNGAGNSLAIRNYTGDITLLNKTGPENVEINMATGGHISLDNTITNGDIRITGIAEVTDNSTGNTFVDITHVIFPDQLQLASFNKQIYLNPNSGVSGVKYPIGTLQRPSNNLADTLAIADTRGLEMILIGGTVVVTDTDVSGKIFVGENNLDAVMVFSGSGNTTTKCTFKNMILSGRLNGYIYAEATALQSVSNIGSNLFPTVFRDCIIRGDVSTPAISLNSGATENIHFINCSSGVPGNGTATLDINDSLSPLAFRKYGGGIKLINMTGNQDCTFEFDQGQIIIDSTCTSGKVRLGGIYKLTDNGTLTIEERNQSITDNISVTGGTFSADTTAIAAAVWDKLTADHETSNTFGKMLNDILVATGQAQHSLNVNTELLQNKPNNP